MKTISFLFLLVLFQVQQVSAQEKYTLEQFQKMARENHPVLRQASIYGQILTLKNQNNTAALYPQFTLNGQATYQSDVTKIGISLPNMSIPVVDKDQYKIYLDLKQIIWDGGLRKAKEEINQIENEGNLQQTEVELYQIKEKVNQFFFTAFLIQENLKVLDKKAETLDVRRKTLESAVKNGMVLASELDQLLSEIIKTRQIELELKSSLTTVLSALSILTGIQIGNVNQLSLADETFDANVPLLRPEIDLFRKQNDLLTINANMLQKQRNPKIFGFGQAGYGKPGLNMLNNRFDTYYLAGIGMSWNVLDWKVTSRQKQMIRLQQELVQTKEETFVRNIDLASDQQYKQIDQLREQIKSDDELIAIRERITKTSASKLEFGNITTADYIQDLNAETMARITLETHKIQLREAIAKINNIRGKQ